MMMWYGNGMSGWGYGLMGIGMVLFWVLLIVGLVALVRYIGSPAQRTLAGAPASPAPRDSSMMMRK